MTTIDRLSDGYEPKFDVDYEIGRQGELFVADVLASIGTSRIEVKTDVMADRTGNVYIEFECRGRPSGIAVSDAEFWAWFLPNDVVVITRTGLVREVARSCYRAGRIARCQRGSHPTRGALVPMRWLVPRLQDAAINTPF